MDIIWIKYKKSANRNLYRVDRCCVNIFIKLLFPKGKRNGKVVYVHWMNEELRKQKAEGLAQCDWNRVIVTRQGSFEGREGYKVVI